MTAYFPGDFTFPGKQRAALRMAALRRAAAAALLSLLALTGPAGASPPHSGPTSSASVGISLSVAPRYGLKASGPAIHARRPGALGPGGLCIATNGQPALLPVMLVRASSGRAGPGPAAAETATPLAWCHSERGALPAGDLRKRDEPPALLIVRPE